MNPLRDPISYRTAAYLSAAVGAALTIGLGQMEDYSRRHTAIAQARSGNYCTPSTQEIAQLSQSYQPALADIMGGPQPEEFYITAEQKEGVRLHLVKLDGKPTLEQRAQK